MCVGIFLHFTGCRCGTLYRCPIIRCPRPRQCPQSAILRELRYGSCPRCMLLGFSIVFFYAVNHALNPTAPVDFGVQALPMPGDPDHQYVSFIFAFETCLCGDLDTWMGPESVIVPRPYGEHPPQHCQHFAQILWRFGYCPRCTRFVASGVLWLAYWLLSWSSGIRYWWEGRREF
jgi:hypothetical protein